MPTRNLNWLFTALVVSLLCHGEANRNRFAGLLSESIDKITALYVEPVDARALFEGGMDGMMAQLDPYSGYISAADYQQFRVDIEQQFGGIGIEVGMENEQLTVLNPVPGKPAYEAGLMAGDIIVSIDGVNVQDATLDDAVRLMRGEIGTEVVVEVQHRGEQVTSKYTIRRARIDIESIRGDRRDAQGNWVFTLEDHPRIGYIRLASFGDHTTSDLYTALESVSGQLDGVIMDLRGNAGGLLDAAVEICNMFIPAGEVIVTTRGRDSQIVDEFRAEHAPVVAPSLRVVVLVDRFSASASEIFAACLQDHDRATIVGERSWGKGTVQNVIDLEGGKSAMRLTTQTYWRPSGENIHRHRTDTEEAAWGVRPKPEDLVEFTTDEYKQVYLQRRQRDLVPRPAEQAQDRATNSPSGGQHDEAAGHSAERPDPAVVESPTGADAPTSSNAATTVAGPPVTDRQLQRAIEILAKPAVAHN